MFLAPILLPYNKQPSRFLLLLPPLLLLLLLFCCSPTHDVVKS
jgi:hypothetical protein